MTSPLSSAPGFFISYGKALRAHTIHVARVFRVRAPGIGRSKPPSL
ncbi:MAG: hypothetical protein QM820_63040 [Minicystis sp.]